jgi:hypothetical protein
MNWAIYEVGASVIPLTLTIDQEGAGGVVGKSPTVALRNAATSNSYLDWADSTFKAAGWTTKYASMTEIERGHYQRILDSSAVAAIVDETVLAAEFHVDDGGDVVGDDADLLVFTDGFGGGGGASAAAVWDEILAGHVIAGSAGKVLQEIRIEEEEDDFRMEPAS